MSCFLRLFACLLLTVIFTSCEPPTFLESSSGSSSSSGGGSTAGTTNNTSQGSVPAGSVPASDLQGYTWLHANVSGWPQTATLRASVSGSTIRLNYDKANVWPGVQNVNASAWVLFSYQGKNYASTFDYLRPGQTTKHSGFYIPVAGTRWQPSSGERVGFMVSGLARDRRRNVLERSNVDWLTWP